MLRDYGHGAEFPNAESQTERRLTTPRSGDGERSVGNLAPSRVTLASSVVPITVTTDPIVSHGPDVGPKTRQLVTRPAPLRRSS